MSFLWINARSFIKLITISRCGYCKDSIPNAVLVLRGTDQSIIGRRLQGKLREIYGKSSGKCCLLWVVVLGAHRSFKVEDLRNCSYKYPQADLILRKTYQVVPLKFQARNLVYYDVTMLNTYVSTTYSNSTKYLLTPLKINFACCHWDSIFGRRPGRWVMGHLVTYWHSRPLSLDGLVALIGACN